MTFTLAKKRREVSKLFSIENRSKKSKVYELTLGPSHFLVRRIKYDICFELFVLVVLNIENQIRFKNFEAVRGSVVEESRWSLQTTKIRGN